MELWHNKVAVVSGSSSGIGAACAKAMVQAGLIVVGLARRHKRILDIKSQLNGELHNNLYALQCDVTAEDDVVKAFQWINNKMGGCDVLVNSAGIMATTELSQQNNTKAIRDTLETNVMGTVFCSREAFHSMCTFKSGMGHIFIVNSIAGQQVPNLGHMLPSLNIYPGTKFALKAMHEIYRQEFQRKQTKVRITTICPGLVDTDIMPHDIQQILKPTVPMLKAADIADAILWALSTPPSVQVNNITIKPMGEKF